MLLCVLTDFRDLFRLCTHYLMRNHHFISMWNTFVILPWRQNRFKMLPSPSFLTSTAAKSPNNTAVALRLSLSDNENPSKRCHCPPHVTLRQRKPFKMFSKGTCPSLATKRLGIVAVTLQITLFVNEYVRKRCRESSCTRLRQLLPFKLYGQRMSFKDKSVSLGRWGHILSRMRRAMK